MPSRSPRATVLVVDDEEGVRHLLRRQLTSAGHTVLEASCGPEALGLARQHAHELGLVLADVVMPTMNGVDLVAAAAPLRPDMAVLFMSGHPERAGVGLDPQGPQAANLLMKPFTPEVVVGRINQLIAQKTR